MTSSTLMHVARGNGKITYKYGVVVEGVIVQFVNFIFKINFERR